MFRTCARLSRAPTATRALSRVQWPRRAAAQLCAGTHSAETPRTAGRSASQAVPYRSANSGLCKLGKDYNALGVTQLFERPVYGDSALLFRRGALPLGGDMPIL